MSTYPKWFPENDYGAKSVDFHRSTANVPYISLLLIIITGVLSPFLLLIIVHPEIDFIVGMILYSLAFLITLRLCYRLLGRKPITLIVKPDTVQVKYLFKKKEIRPDNLSEISILKRLNKTKVDYFLNIKISTSSKEIKIIPADFKNNPTLFNTLEKIASTAKVYFDPEIKTLMLEPTPNREDVR